MYERREGSLRHASNQGWPRAWTSRRTSNVLSLSRYRAHDAPRLPFRPLLFCLGLSLSPRKPTTHANATYYYERDGRRAAANGPSPTSQPLTPRARHLRVARTASDACRFASLSTSHASPQSIQFRHNHAHSTLAPLALVQGLCHDLLASRAVINKIQPHTNLCCPWLLLDDADDDLSAAP